MKLEQIEVDGKNYFLPVSEQLYKSKPELKTPETGDWYVYYSIWDFSSGKWKPYKFYSKFLNTKELLKNKTQRRKNGAEVVTSVYDSLIQGVNPKTGLPLSPFIDKTVEEMLSASKDKSPIPTVRVAIEKWLAMKSGNDNPGKVAPENKENTAYTYKYFFGKFLAYCEKNSLDFVRMDKVAKHKVYHFFEERYNKGEIGDSTWNSQLGHLQGMFAYFARLYDYKDNIVNIDEKEVIDDSERFEPFTPEQVQKIFNHLDTGQLVKFHKYSKVFPPNKFLALVARTIFYSFIRVSELRRIKIKNVKRYKEGYFTLSTSITKTKKKVFNELYLDPRLVEEYSKLGWEKYFKDKKYDNYYVFTPDLIPSPVKTNTYRFSKSFQAVLKHPDVNLYDESKFSLYSLKASGNIDAYNSGWDLFQISLQNRHTTVKQTETYLRKLKCNIADRPRPERKVF